MITPIKNDGVLDVFVTANALEYRGLSTDAKPAVAVNGAAFIEFDTGKLYFFDAVSATWLEWGAE